MPGLKPVDLAGGQTTEIPNMVIAIHDLSVTHAVGTWSLCQTL